MRRNAPKKGLGPKDDWGGYGNKESYVRNTPVEVMAGGNLKSLLASAATRLASPARNAARNIGLWASEAPPAGTYVPKTGKMIQPRGDVYTSQGVFKGKDVFIKKADLTKNQIAGIQKGLETKAARQLATQVRIGAKAATAAGAIGWLGGVFTDKVVDVAKDTVKTIRGDGKKKKK